MKISTIIIDGNWPGGTLEVRKETDSDVAALVHLDITPKNTGVVQLRKKDNAIILINVSHPDYFDVDYLGGYWDDAEILWEWRLEDASQEE